ncbi:MAG: domain S-box protein [Chitinophagaceae bacterium]|nr:domain S-box protein [Chitinophagaceae bacterium]
MDKIMISSTYQSRHQGKLTATARGDSLCHQAFDNSLQANIITTVGNGTIVMVNEAACKLLGYSKKALLNRNRSAIFDINQRTFKRMLKQRTAEGRSIAFVTARKKNGRVVPCEITSAVFMDEDGIAQAITTIADLSQNILRQKHIDLRKEKIVADNIDLVKSRQKKIDAKKDKVVADNIDLAISKQKKIDYKRNKIVSDNIDLVKSNQRKIDAKKEKKVSDNINLAKSKQRKIDIKNEKIVLGNIILAQAKSDASQTENSEWKKNLGKTLYDVIWDWNIVSGQIYVSDSIEELFGYYLQNNTISFTDFRRFLLPEEKEGVEKKLFESLASHDKSWNDSYRLKRNDGSIASTTSRASIIRDKEGKAIHLIGTVKDISKMEELKRKLDEQIIIKNESSEGFNLAAKLSYDGLWDWNILTNEFFLGAGFEELFGYPVRNADSIGFDWINYLHPDDKEAVEKGLHAALASSGSNWEHAYRFIKTDGTIANVFGRASIIRGVDGKACRMIGVIHDLSRQKELEEKLSQEIRLKEKQIAQATEEAKETERYDIGKELHDNVNQLLGASRLYIEMAKRGGEDSAMHLSRSAEYTLAAIEEIRKLTKRMTTDTIKNFGLCEAIASVSRDTMEIYPVKISCALQSFVEDTVNDKFKLNLFRIVQEQLNNILKHARATEVTIGLSQNMESIILIISDNGVGFDIFKKQKGIGMSNMKNRAACYNGTAVFDSKPGKGCILTVVFPVKEDIGTLKYP